MSKGFRLDPLRRLFGSFGSLWWQGLKGIEQELTIPGDADAEDYVLQPKSTGPQYTLISDLITPGAATFPFGCVMEWGDGLTASVVLQNQIATGRVIAPGGGVTLNSIRVDAFAAVTCQLDIFLNGVSIFGAGSTKPNLAAGTTYHDTTFAGTVDRTWSDDDLLVGKILSLSGDPLQLAMTLKWE